MPDKVFSIIHALGQRGIIPECISDNSIAKQGTRIMAIPVISPTEDRTAFPDALDSNISALQKEWVYHTGCWRTKSSLTFRQLNLFSIQLHVHARK